LAIAIIFIALYFWYINLIIDQSKKYFKSHEKKMIGEKISVTSKIFVAVINTIIMGFATYFLTKSAVEIAHILNISPLVVGFSIVALTTSIPNVIIAIENTRRGRIDDVVSGVFGANIFTILVALGLPVLLLSTFFQKEANIISDEISLMVGLILATIVVLFFIIDDYIITKKNAIIMLLSYMVFLIYLFILTY